MADGKTTRSRYSTEQILVGLQILIPDSLGCELPFDEETNFIEHLKAEGILDEVDFADVVADVHEFFGFECDHREWWHWLGHPVGDYEQWECGHARRLTFGSLASFIAERAEVVSLEPVNLLGRPCAAAGAFRGVEQVAKQILRDPVRFGPSTRIQDRLRGTQLRHLWKRLQWVSLGRLPKLNRRGQQIADLVVLFLSLSLMVLLFVSVPLVALDIPEPLPAVLGVVLLFASVVVLYVLGRYAVDQLVSQLPVGIETFRDLALLLVDKHPSEDRWRKDGASTMDRQTESRSLNPYESPKP